MTWQRFHFQFVLMLLAAASLFGVQAAPGQDKDEVHVLWIGNSLIYYNDLPKMVAALAKAGGQRAIIYEQETPGGCTLEKHWNDGKAIKKLRSRKWDFVVLQEQSQRPLVDSGPMFEYATKFDTEIHKQGGKTLLYLPFPLAKAPKNQAKLTKLHEDLAAKLKARVVPVGPAWARVQAGNAPPSLFNDDGAHPNRTGSYLAACVFYAAIYGKSPEELPGKIGGLSDEEARPLQAIAWQVVKDFALSGAAVVGAGQAQVAADPFQVKSVWVNDDNKMTLTVTERDGESFQAKWQIGDRINRIVNGTIKGNKVSWQAKDVRAVKGGVGGDNYGTIAVNTINFVWQEDKGGSGKFTLSLRK
jgi:hypothetical protein